MGFSNFKLQVNIFYETTMDEVFRLILQNIQIARLRLHSLALNSERKQFLKNA